MKKAWILSIFAIRRDFSHFSLLNSCSWVPYCVSALVCSSAHFCSSVLICAHMLIFAHFASFAHLHSSVSIWPSAYLSSCSAPLCFYLLTKTDWIFSIFAIRRDFSHFSLLNSCSWGPYCVSALVCSSAHFCSSVHICAHMLIFAHFASFAHLHSSVSIWPSAYLSNCSG